MENKGDTRRKKGIQGGEQGKYTRRKEEYKEHKKAVEFFVEINSQLISAPISSEEKVTVLCENS